MRDLRRFLALLGLGLLVGAASWAQESEAPDEEPAETEPAAEIDEESYLDIDEEDFRPSEEIGADQSIPFPTDI